MLRQISLVFFATAVLFVILLAFMVYGRVSKQKIPAIAQISPIQAPEDTKTAIPEQIEALEAIAYLPGKIASIKPVGVGVYIKGKCFEGLNIYSSGHFPGAILMDMEGQELHRWEMPFEKAFPGSVPPSLKGAKYWRNFRLFPNGDLLAVFGGNGIIKVDKDSKLLWANVVPAHHAFDVLPNGDIWTLTRRGHIVPRIHPEYGILEDYVALISGGDGKLLKEISLLEALEQSDYAHFWAESEMKYGDSLHNNTVYILTAQDAAWDVPGFEEGNLLLSYRNLDLIAVLNPTSQRIVWATKGPFVRQHDPQILPDGRMMLFDNLGAKPYSAIRIADPPYTEFKVFYQGNESYPFFSEEGGAEQWLGNGNTLIISSEPGIVFEISASGELLWEFVTPYEVEEEGEKKKASVFNMVRVPGKDVEGWLDLK